MYQKHSQHVDSSRDGRTTSVSSESVITSAAKSKAEVSFRLHPGQLLTHSSVTSRKRRGGAKLRSM